MRRGSAWRALITGLIALSATAAAARCNPEVAPPALRGDEMICLSVARIWRGSLEDIRNIETTQVPASFRDDYEPDGTCKNTVPHSLVDWHFEFGSLRSTGAALAYLEGVELRSAPAPEAYLLELRRAWRAAQPDLQCARTVREPPDASYSASALYMARSRPISRFESLLAAHRGYFFIAEQYLRAAEEFGSLELLAKAEAHLRPLVEEIAFLQPLEDQPPADGLLHFNLQAFRTDDLRMRAAVARARMSGGTEDLAAAEALVASFERPHYARIAESAYSGGDGFCDISGGWSRADVIEQTCRDDEAIHERVTGYWINRAILDLAARRTDRSAFELATRLLEEERSPDRQTRCCWRNANDDLFNLLLAAAAENARVATGTDHDANYDRRRESWEQAASDLRGAERLISPADAPSRFRRVARIWVSLWSQAGRSDDPSDGRPGPVASHPDRRFDAYVRTLLTHLDAIAVGDPPNRELNRLRF